MDPEMLARLVFCFENNPERHDGIISGAQDSIGICVPGLVRHYYDNNFWPEKIKSTQDDPPFPGRPSGDDSDGTEKTGMQDQPVAVAQWYRMDCWTAGWRTASVLGCQHCYSLCPGGYLRAFCGAGATGLCHPHLCSYIDCGGM